MLSPSTSLSPAVIERSTLLPRAPDGPTASIDLLIAVLEHTEHAVVVADATGRALYMNASARSFLDSPLGVMPPWMGEVLPAVRAQVERHGQAVDRLVHGDLTVRLRARHLPRPGTLLLELAIAQGSGQRQMAEQLARGLGLPITDARLLALLWRGLSNEEIAGELGVRTGTIKSRLFRLYQRLGVKKRPAAVLRAQEVLAA
ncbi:MAG: LuxR C-terminal-related transcriptional regulator [Kofleriaceae bacterium]